MIEPKNMLDVALPPHAFAAVQIEFIPKRADQVTP
jgi:hypothetical protein